MTQEEKQLLLQDLCARLPYGVKVAHTSGLIGLVTGIHRNPTNLFVRTERGCLHQFLIGNIKPYLRPMSSMTEEEKTQVQMFMDIVKDENYGDGHSPSAWDAMNGFVQYCDSHHLDHRGLIFRGLALEAPEGMYNLKEK